jgi:hypothetical protein
MRVRRRGDDVVLSLATEEVGVLTTLAQQTLELVGAGPAESSPDPLERALGAVPTDATAVPDDPALARVFPAAYADDDEASAEFRRLMTGDLQREKAEALRAVLAALPGTPPQRAVTIRLSTDDAERWLGAVNDIRLVLGVRADVQEDMSAYLEELRPDDPRLPLLVAYDFLTFLQQSMLEAIDPALGEAD